MALEKTFIWEEDADKVCALLDNSPTTLRIILKTKDDELHFERWINHYSNIVKDPADIIIFDNMSTNKTVLDAYERYGDKITLIKHSQYFNDLHDAVKFSDLYAAIWRSSKYYIFVDTDELLFLYKEGKAIAGSAVVDLLEKSDDVSFFPTFWLKNALFRDDVFIFKDTIEYIRYLAVMGKPVLRSESASKCIRKPMIHSLQMPIAMYGKAPCCFLLFHLSSLSKNHRIRTNMNKLVQHGLLQHTNDFKTVLSIDIDTMRHGVYRYLIREIRKLLATPDDAAETVGSGHIGPGHIGLLPDGTLRFYPPEAKAFFDKYVNCNTSFFELLAPVRAVDVSPDTLIWSFYDNESYTRGIPPQMKWELDDA